jgi:flagellar export protein FliJ
MSRRKIQKVLEVKGLTKDQINISFQRSRDALEVENTKLDSAVRTFERTLDEFNKKHQEGPIHTQELDFFYTYLSYLNEQIEQQKHTVSSRLAEVEQIQKTLVNAHKEEKIFEIFYSKILDEEKRETLKVEQKEADFQYLSRKSRR